MIKIQSEKYCLEKFAVELSIKAIKKESDPELFNCIGEFLNKKLRGIYMNIKKENYESVQEQA